MRVLLIAYGNSSRGDDGVAFYVIHRLRARLGFPVGEPTNAYSDTDRDPAILCAHQLSAEMAEILRQYDVVIFIDAHIAHAQREPVHWEAIKPSLCASFGGHHIQPSMLLGLCKAFGGHCPEGYILSILGMDWGFSESLSAETSQLADQAVEIVLEFLKSAS